MVFKVILAAALAGCVSPAKGQQQESKIPISIQVCAEKTTPFNDIMVDAFIDHFWVLEQDYLPIDSFGIIWSTEGRTNALPHAIGLLWEGSLIVTNEILTPWKKDSFFLKNQKEYYWKEGKLKEVYAWNLMDYGKSEPNFQFQIGKIDTIDERLMAYRELGLPEELKEVPKATSEEIFRQGSGYLLLLRSNGIGYEFCFEKGNLEFFNMGQSLDFAIDRDHDVVAGIYVILFVEDGGNSIQIRKVGYLTQNSSNGLFRVLRGR
jgi:hypothetical protein